jgi:LuxR family maltose regulon positive regulatory protein
MRHERDMQVRPLVERPRLTHALDAAGTRILLLTAPAGYGKTTLAREWLDTRSHANVWLKATPASHDVAGLASALANAASVFAPDAPSVVHDFLQTLKHPPQHAVAIAEALASALEDCSPDLCLVVDDYDFVRAAESSDLLVEALVGATHLRVMIAARRRPRWVTARRLLYREVFELGQSDLAFTEDEARTVMGTDLVDDGSVLWHLTKGWPALTGLAALRGQLELPGGDLPPDLHRYFAEELFENAPPHLQEALRRIAILPRLTPALTKLALGDNADAICEEAHSHGFLAAAADGGLEVHPLIGAFLNTKLNPLDVHTFALDVIDTCLAEGAWDDAFAVIQRFHHLDRLPRLFAAAMEPLLREHRLATLERWIAFAAETRQSFPHLDIAEAEIMRRLGKFDVGETRAINAAKGFGLGEWASTACAIAGECALLDYRPLDALAHHRRAEQLAESAAGARRALWGQFAAATQAEDPSAGALLDQFDALADGGHATRLRAASGRLMLAMLEGDLEEELATHAPHIDLVARVDDPLVTTSFLYRLAYTHAICGKYASGLRLSYEAQVEAGRTKLRFAATHIEAAQAAATLGLRQLKRAEMLISRLQRMAREIGDTFEDTNSRALLARLLLARGQARDAADAMADFSNVPTKSLRGECAALRALGLAVQANDRASSKEAEALATTAFTTTREIQAQTLACVAGSVIELIADDAADTWMNELEMILLRRHNWDSLVCGYRAYPPLLSALRERQRIPVASLEQLLRGACDRSLAAKIGWRLRVDSRSGDGLSPREREVYELLSRGLTNRQIAECLVISEATVKVHVRHILEKLGVRTRTEAAAQLQEP